METITAVALLIAAIALLIVTIGLAWIALGFKRLLDEASQLVKVRVGRLFEEGEHLLASLTRASGNVEQHLASVGRLLERAEAVVAHFDPKSLGQSVVRPVIVSVLSWITGAKRAISTLRHPSEKRGGEKDE